nr:hypothetical protein [Clostridioides difficile]
MEDEEKIPAIYKTVEQVVKVDKNSIKDFIKKVMRSKVAGLNMELH